MSQKERENFYRNSTAIVDHGNAALTILLENELSCNNESFTDFINRNQHEIYHLYENKRPCCQCINGILPPSTPRNRVLHLEQINLLIDQHGNLLPAHGLRLTHTQPLCCRQAKTTTTLKDIDITLKRCLLVNFATNCARGRPVRQAVENLVEYRNKLYGHAKEATMADNDFQNNFADVEREILIIAQFCNAEIEMRQKLQDTKIRPLDDAICRQYQSQLLSEIAKTSEIKEEVLDLKREIRESNQKMQHQLTDINVNMENNFSGLNEMQKEQITSVEILYNRVKDSEDNIRADIEASKQHLATKIDCLEDQISYEHMELHGQVEQTENNIKTCIIEARNVISKEVKDLRQETAEREKKEHIFLDETIKLIQQTNKSDQRKQNIVAQTKSRIKLHTENLNYVETRAVKEGQVVLEKEGILFLVSKGGEGKTTTCLQLASLYQANGYVPLLFIDQEIRQYRDVINPHEKCIVIIDDLFGRTNVEFDDNIHTNLLDFLFNLVKDHKGVKLIFTVRQNPMFSVKIFDKHRIFIESMILDLDTKWKLSNEEKRDILLRYMDTNNVYSCSCQADLSFIAVYYQRNVYNCKEKVIIFPDKSAQICKTTFYNIIVNKHYIGFPEGCRLFCSDRTFTVLGMKYFESPTQSLVNKMKQLFMQGFENKISKYQYCILVYMALQETETATANNLEGNTFLKTVFDDLYDDKNVKIRKTFLEEALKLMEGTMLEKLVRGERAEVWQFKHETICEAVRMSVGNECPKMLLNVDSLNFILKYVMPRSSKCDESDQSVKIYISDDDIINKFERVFKQEREKTRQSRSLKENDGLYYSSADEIGMYMRKCALVNRNDRFLKRFFELIPIKTFPTYEISGLFDGLTNYGKDKSIIHYHTDIFDTFNLNWFNRKATLALCRPKSSNLDANECIFVDDMDLLLHLISTMKSFDYSENDYKIFDIGRFLFTVGMQEGNHRFVSNFFKLLIFALKFLGMEGSMWILIDGITDGGKRREILPFYFDFFNKYLLEYGSLLVILRLCSILGEPIDDAPTSIVIAEHDFIKQASIKFACCLYGVGYYRHYSGEIQMKDIGSELFLFLMKIKNKTFVYNLLQAFSKCHARAFCTSNIDIRIPFSILRVSSKVEELLAFLDGFTENGKNMEYLQQNYDFFVSPIKHTCRFVSYLKGRVQYF